MKHLKSINDLFENIFALNSIKSIFNDDAHSIVSKRGAEILSREKIHINGYEYYLDREKQILYPEEYSKNGVHYDSDNRSYVFASHMTKNEREQLLNHLRK